MKWKNELEKFGLTNETISHGLRNKIKDYYEMVEGINELRESIANPSVNDDVEELKSELVDLQESLQDYDNQLVRAVQLFDKNKEKYAQISKNLGKGRPRKDGQTTQVKAVATPTTTTTEKPIVAQPQVQAQTVETKTEEDKKKGNWGLFFGALALGIVTFGLYKSREQ
jgi:hypothetical protein